MARPTPIHVATEMWERWLNLFDLVSRSILDVVGGDDELEAVLAGCVGVDGRQVEGICGGVELVRGAVLALWDGIGVVGLVVLTLGDVHGPEGGAELDELAGKGSTDGCKGLRAVVALPTVNAGVDIAQ